jgi:hypothetical protein
MAAVADAAGRRPSSLMAVLLTAQREMESMVYMVYGEAARRGQCRGVASSDWRGETRAGGVGAGSPAG